MEVTCLSNMYNLAKQNFGVKTHENIITNISYAIDPSYAMQERLHNLFKSIYDLPAGCCST